MADRFESPGQPAEPSVALVLAVATALVVGIVGATIWRAGDEGERSEASQGAAAAIKTPPPINTAIEGLTTFRGNASRSYYGEGPVPLHPVIRWQSPADEKLCSDSIVGVDQSEWCGTGWTGQPNVIQQPDGAIEVREGAYDANYHFVDGLTGEAIGTPYVTRDLAKGSASSDPDGFPLYYAGSRDGHFRVIAMDRPEPTLLWDIDADTTVPLPLRNNDWDGAALIVGDYLLEGGENGWLYVVHLNRGYDEQGLVTVDPGDRRHDRGVRRRAARQPGRPRGLDRELGRLPQGDRVLRELGRVGAGLGHLRPARGRHVLQPGVPVLGG